MAFQRAKKDEWIIAIRNRSSSLLVNGNYNDFKFVPNTLRYWCADPFLFSYSGRRYLFFEMYDRIKRKGAIGFRIINEDGTLSKITKCYEASTHLSYPFVFCNKDNEIFIMPENSRSQELYLLRAKNFPLEWEKIVISCNVRLVDTTLFKYNDCLYAYSTRIAQDNVSQLELYIFDEANKKLLPYSINPIKNDKLGGRMGGRVFVVDNKLIRSAQDSRNGYGGGLAFFEITNVDDEAYEETLLGTISPKDIVMKNNKYVEGLHTYNFDEKYEVIDLKRKTINLLEWWGFFMNKIKKHIK